ncbi:molybdopterin-dependent oxidoreductase [uncultured Sulfitobacter sp.]|uniref:molybdopterin-dependent oxidoreductase n=1 Tax=uncultured Sulfitobacter sp. TaxID=191468 RepID=UPI00262C998F|nr:molybdopterin-dependent oxidoreductase [uncultured Sulfitobacter sp.]
MLRNTLQAISITLCMTVPAWAGDMVTPTGEVMLSVSGNLNQTNADGAALLDLEMLQALDQTIIETSTIWTEGKQTFEGVSLAVLVEALGITGGTLRATAINDYTVEVPLTDAVEGGPIVAYRLNGETMSVRDKGPLWLVYPYDDNSDYRTEVVYSRSIWQLDRIEAVD